MKGARFLHRMLAGGLLLVALGGWWFVGRSQLTSDILQPSDTTQPDMRVQDVHVVEQAETGALWELVAQEAELYDAEHRIVGHRIRASSLPSTAIQPLQVIADYSQMDHTTGNLLLQGHVRLTYLNEYTILTDVLHWHPASRSISTPVTVQVQSALVRIAGLGFLGQVDEQRFVLQDDVHATFHMR